MVVYAEERVWATLIGAHGSLLALRSGVSPGGAQGTLDGVRDPRRVGHI